jgi:uncharacterized protein (TIGR02145 family)
MKLFHLFILLVLLVNCGFSQSSTLIEEIIIEKQVWMGSNLNVSNFRNGDAIPQASSKSEWKKYNKAKKPAWCYYENNSKNQEVYGKLYNWYAVIDPRGLAPEGWHIPTDAEWSELTKNSGGQEMSGQFLKSKIGWSKEGNGTDFYGFSIFPAGDCSRFMSFNGFGDYSYFWTASEEFIYYAWTRYFNNSNSITVRIPIDKQFGLSVRCVKNKEE